MVAPSQEQDGRRHRHFKFSRDQRCNLQNSVHAITSLAVGPLSHVSALTFYKNCALLSATLAWSALSLQGTSLNKIKAC